MLLVAAQDGRWHRAHAALAGADCKNQTLRGIPPTSTWAELPQAGQQNSPWKEGAAVISPSWALQLC